MQQLTTAAALQGFSVLLGVFVLISIGFLLKGLQRNQAVIKARLFLHYDKLSHFFTLVAVLMAIVTIVQMYTWAALTPVEWFGTEAMGNFVPYGVYSLAVYGGVIYFCLTIWNILKDVK